MKKTALVLSLALLALGASCSSAHQDPLVVGAVYPLSGAQGPGGIDEFRGVDLAVRMVDDAGGVRGRRIELHALDVSRGDAAPGAVDQLHSQGVRFVLGSYGSTISQPAAYEADHDGMLYWETGAVGEMAPEGQGRLVFRVAPSGVVLGGAAISFVAKQLAPVLHRDPATLRYAVANVDDVYGTAVANGAIGEIRALHLPFAGDVPYDPHSYDAATVVRQIAALKPDVLFVSAYLQDGVALRREMVRQKLPLVANIGSSSSYCMPAFGAALGKDAVGVYASDKPDGDAINPSGLLPAARRLLARARSEYRDRYHETMSAAALSGFSAAWALFTDVMPKASSLTPVDVGTAALRADVPAGGLPNGSGLRFAGPGATDAGSNVLARGVIWEWTRPDWRDVVWPPQFATAPLRPLSIGW
jgi:branched-chain amino acid transport system substrate-binding protein